MPNISIIVPTYNSSNFVYNLSKSIVEQTYEDFEVIIVDNFSKDGTIDKIKSQTRNDQRFKMFRELFSKLNITKNLNEKLEIWNYKSLNETVRIAQQIKKQLS